MLDLLTELEDSADQVLRGMALAPADAKLWPQACELGWLLVTAPEELGGLDLGLAGACALQLALGRYLAGASYLPALLAAEALCASTLPDRQERLARLAAGEDYITCPLVDWRPAAGHGLSGMAMAVPAADRAGQLLVVAPDLVALVPLAAAGVTVTRRATWDSTRDLFEVVLDGVDTNMCSVLARGAQAQALAQRLAVVRDFGLAADAVGGADALLAMTVDYLQTRRQFGRPLAMFQALKHRCADLKADVEAARALLLDNLQRAAAADDAATALLAKGARHLACAVYLQVAEESLQLHGGIGMTAEHPCHLFLKRAMLGEHLGTAPGACAEALAAPLLAAQG